MAYYRQPGYGGYGSRGYGYGGYGYGQPYGFHGNFYYRSPYASQNHEPERALLFKYLAICLFRNERPIDYDEKAWKDFYGFYAQSSLREHVNLHRSYGLATASNKVLMDSWIFSGPFLTNTPT